MSDRDPSDPEILAAGQERSGDFAEVALVRAAGTGRFRFGVSAAARAVLQRILSTHPFDTTSGIAYRYFYAGQGGYGAPVKHLLYVRIDQGAESRTLEFESPEDLVGILEWFRQVPSLAAVAHLQVPA